MYKENDELLSNPKNCTPRTMNGNLYIAGDCNIDTDTLGKLFSDPQIYRVQG